MDPTTLYNIIGACARRWAQLTGQDRGYVRLLVWVSGQPYEDKDGKLQWVAEVSMHRVVLVPVTPSVDRLDALVTA